VTVTSEYACEVREVFSGDDLVAMVDLGVENLWKRQRIRLHGVDTPTAIGAAPDTDAGKVRAYIRNLTRGRKGRLTVVSRNTNSWVVTLVVETFEGTSVNVNEYLIAQGYQFKR
jgi:endonuclease YncB( thermonuclease family)